MENDNSSRPFPVKVVTGLATVVVIGGAALYLTSVKHEEVPVAEPTPQTNELPVDTVSQSAQVAEGETDIKSTTATVPVAAGVPTNTTTTPAATTPTTPTTPVKTTPTPTPTPTTPTPTEPAVVPQNKYKDGSYTATGAYSSPAGSEQVTITLVLKDDVVTSATFVGNANNPGSKMAQDAFAAGFKEKVVGKSIDSISLSVVNGSSLTPRGFMNALAKIKAEAQA